VLHSACNKDPGENPRIIIEQTHPIRSVYLERYLWDRRIPFHVARLFCLEAWYHREKKLYHALAFGSDAGGFELFDRNRHYRVPPCGPTLIRQESRDIAVFRNVIDMLTFVAFFAGPIQKLPDLFVLNGPVPLQAVQEVITPYHKKHLFLPNDTAGITFCKLAYRAFQNCRDQSALYSGYPTLNDWICRIGTATARQFPGSCPPSPSITTNP
jgi:hypothetical protein